MKPSQFFGSLFIFVWLVTFFLGDNLDAVIAPQHAAELLAYQWWILLAGVSLIALGFADEISDQRNKARRKRRSRPANKTPVLRTDPSDYQTTLKGRDRAEFTPRSDNTKPHNTRVNNSVSIAEAAGTAQPSVVQKHRPQSISKKDAAQLESLAKKLDWNPLVGGGANFRTGKLVKQSSSRIETRSSAGLKLFSGVFIGMGTGIPGLIAVSSFADKGLNGELVVPFLFGALFSAIGIVMLLFPRPRCFDKQIGWFWAGKPSVKNHSELLQLKKALPLEQIAALQIVPERVSSKKGSYTSWELNLVAGDARRFNVLDHANRAAIDEDAGLLGEFLAVPVWEKGNTGPDLKPD